MSDSAVYAFCESKYRKLIVAIVTAVVGLALLLPLTDVYSDNSESRRALTEELGNAKKMESTLPGFKKRVADLQARAAEIEALTISEESLVAYRDELTKMVRESGCKLRTLDTAKPTTRAWLQKDDPLRKETPPKNAKRTKFKLQKRGLTLLVDGEMANIKKLLDTFGEGEQAVFPHRIKLSAGSGRDSTTTLEMNLWLFALTR